MASATASAHNSSPHIDDLFKAGARGVCSQLPRLKETMWSVRHKHFDLSPGEIMLCELSPSSFTTRAVKESDVKDLNPCYDG